VAVTAQTLHLAHFLGPQAAVKVAQADPSTKIRDILSPSARIANPSILGGGATAGSVMSYAQRRADAARRRAGDLTPEEEAKVKRREEIDKEAAKQSEDRWDRYGEHMQGLNDSILLNNIGTAKQSAAAWEEFGNTVADVAKGFVQDMMHGASASEAFRNALARLADAGIDAVFNALGTALGGGGTPGAGGGILGKIFGGSAGAAGAAPLPGTGLLNTPAVATPLARSSQIHVIVSGSPGPYFNAHVAKIAARGDARTLATARDNAPAVIGRFNKLGTTR
jgi:hypothetical protein